LRRTKNNRRLNHVGSLEKRETILAALARATDGSKLPNGPAGEYVDEIHGYYTLSLEELAALVSGDIKKIENWVSHLDQQRATWLLRWLIKERQPSD
jgi:hypothetical protein